jgi:16S rRNA A1518/A1519 N6-dimethyltransferase RsmA/KsgA/DIM1 with predicted DNA glycosylase/AP lyase activity
MLGLLTTTAGIADIGSGTGLLTEVFLNNGYRAFGIEPDPDMRVAAESLLQGYARFAKMIETLEVLFWTHQVNGTVTIEQETRLYSGQLSGT